MRIASTSRRVRALLCFVSFPFLCLLGQDQAAVKPLEVQISVNKPSLDYREGDTLRVSVAANKNCYLRLVYREANGRDVVIFPNYQDRDDKVQGGFEYVLPTLFSITAPFGKESLRAFVSSEKFPTLEGTDRGDGIFILKEPMESVVRKLRSGGIFGEYAEQTLEILTKPKGGALPDLAAAVSTPASIELTQPTPSEFLVEQRDSVVIVGLVRGAEGMVQVTVNGIAARVQQVAGGIQFTKKVGLAVGENVIDLVATDATKRPVRKQIVIRRGEHKFAGQRWAVVVGISDYQHPEITDLKYAHRDAQAFYDFLRSANGGAFPDDHTMLLLNAKATKANLKSAVFDFLKRTQREDLVMIFFSGHGLSRGKGYSYFVAHDTDPYRIEETAFDMEDMQRALESSISAERVLIFADACYSGAVNDYIKGRRTTTLEENLINRYLVEMAKTKPGICSFTSCAENEISGEAWLYWEHGLFTFVLISGLGGKVTDTQGKIKAFESADGDGDGVVTLSELTPYVVKHVSGYTKNKQNPQISNSKFDPNTPLSIVRENR